MEKEWRRKRRASCGWRYCSLSPMIWSILYNLILDCLSDGVYVAEGGSQQSGACRLVTWKPGVLDMKESRAWGSLEITSGFLWLSCKPSSSAACCTVWRSSMMASGLSPKVPSSRYQTQNSDFSSEGTKLLILFHNWYLLFVCSWHLFLMDHLIIMLITVSMCTV